MLLMLFIYIYLYDDDVTIVKELVDGLYTDRLSIELQRYGVVIPSKTSGDILRFRLIKAIIDKELSSTNGGRSALTASNNNGDDTKLNGEGGRDVTTEMSEKQYRSMINLSSYSYTRSQLEIIKDTHLKEIAKSKQIQITRVTKEYEELKKKYNKMNRIYNQLSKSIGNNRSEIINEMVNTHGIEEKDIVIGQDNKLVPPSLNRIIIQEILSTKKSYGVGYISPRTGTVLVANSYNHQDI